MAANKMATIHMAAIHMAAKQTMATMEIMLKLAPKYLAVDFQYLNHTIEFSHLLAMF